MQKPIILDYFDKRPHIHTEAFITPGLAVVGEVTIGKGCSFWFSAVLRGDIEPITLGEYTNVQNGTVIQVTRNGFQTWIGNGVTIGQA